jgi:hypothetical protein
MSDQQNAESVVLSSVLDPPRKTGNRCSICDSPHREAIERAVLINKAPLRKLALQFDVSPHAIIRHRENHLASRLQAGAIRRGATLENEFFDLYQHVKSKVVQFIADAEQAVKFELTGHELCEGGEQVTRLPVYEKFRDLGPMGAALAQAHKNLEILGRVSGVLTEGASVVNNTTIVVSPSIRALQSASEPAAIAASCERVDDTAEDDPEDFEP